MMPNITRGDRMAGLLSYLVGQSSREEHHSNAHTNPHIVGGHDVVVQAVTDGELSMDDALDIANLLDQPRRIFGTKVTVPVKEWDEDAQRKVKIGERDAHVWHASLSIKAGEGPLSDARWGDIARDFVDGMGFTDPDGAGSCRWVAIRHGESEHGNDHIHIAVSLVRENGEKARVHNDYKRAQQLTNELEHKYGLVVLESREQDQSTVRGVKPAELERARREDARAPQRDELRRRIRAAAGAAAGERDFIGRMREHGVLVRPRYAPGNTDKVVGYSAALVPEVKDGVRQSPVWFAGSKLDSTLGLGNLRQRWGADVDGDPRAVPVWKERHRATIERRLDTPPSVVPTRLPVETVRRINELANQIVVPDTSAGLRRWAAIDAAAAFAQASMYLEGGEHGPLADASDTFARIGQQDRYRREDPQRVQRQVSQLAQDAGYMARLTARATGTDSRTGWTAVFRQLSRVGKAIEQEQRARGAVQRADAVATATNTALQTIERINRQAAAQAPQAAPQQPAPGRHRRTNDPNRDTGRGQGYGRG